MLDLDAKRAERAKARRNVDAAGREARGETLPIRIDGEVITTLPAELNLVTLRPLRDLDGEMTLLISKGLDIARARDAKGQGSGDVAMDATALIIDLLVMSPNLPTKLLDIVGEVASGVLGDEGLAKLLAAGPSQDDLRELAKGIFDWFGISLGEALPSLDSSTSDGETSPTTSEATADSTPVTPSAEAETPA